MKRWKVLFLLLLSINLIGIILFVALMFKPADIPEMTNTNKKEGVELIVSTNKENLTALINNYLEKEFKEQVISYQVVIADKVNLIGKIPVFNKEIDLVLSFEPKVLENGNLLLIQDSITLGQVKLPIIFVLQYIRENYALPKWVIVDPQEKQVNVRLTEMKLESKMRVEAKSFDLHEDKLEFKMILPPNK